jgi:hypothetical protein
VRHLDKVMGHEQSEDIAKGAAGIAERTTDGTTDTGKGTIETGKRTPDIGKGTTSVVP